MIHIHWTTLLFIVTLVFLIYKTVRNYSTGNGSGYDFGLDILINIFWLLMTIIFIAAWGGFFWW
jgi:uncharacterized membrane protein